MSLRDTILNADDIPEKIIEVPEWGNIKVLLRGMTGAQRTVYVDLRQGGTKFMHADLLLQTVYDPDTRKPVFDPADREAIEHKSGDVLNRLAAEVLALSTVDVDAAEEELEGNPTSGGS